MMIMMMMMMMMMTMMTMMIMMCLKASVQLNQGTRKVVLLALKIILDCSPFHIEELLHGLVNGESY